MQYEDLLSCRLCSKCLCCFLQANNLQFKRPAPATTDKLITDYLTRHSAPGYASTRQFGRQPLAAMENLQEALTELQLAVGSSRQACALVKPPDTTTTCRSAAKGACHASEAVSSIPVTCHQDVAPQACMPVSATDCAPNASTVASECQERRMSPIPSGSKAPAAQENDPDADLDNRPITCGNPTAAVHDANLQNDESTGGMQRDPGTPAGALTPSTPADSLTPYFTPNNSSLPMYQGLSLSQSSLGDHEEQWYTPPSAGCSAFSASNIASCEANSITNTCTLGALDTLESVVLDSMLDRAGSPILLYGKGGVFSTDFLQDSNGPQGHWLTQ